MVLGISRGIKIEEITQKRKICITFSIFILVILFPQPNFFVVCLKYLHSQKLKILENYQIYSKMLFLKVINKGWTKIVDKFNNLFSREWKISKSKNLKKYKTAANSKLKKYLFTSVFNVILLNFGKIKCLASEISWHIRKLKKLILTVLNE